MPIFVDMANVDELRLKYDSLRPALNERSRRHWAATEARAAGHGGVAAVMLATGLSRNTIARRPSVNSMIRSRRRIPRGFAEKAAGERP